MQSHGSDVDIDAWDWDHCDFESEDYLDNKFFNIHDVYTHNSDTSAFLEQHNEAVNDSVEGYLLDAQNYDEITKNCTSPLFECLVQNVCNLDDLHAGPKAEKTYKATQTAIRSFNFFWLNHSFDPQKESELYAVRSKYGHMWDGFQALC